VTLSMPGASTAKGIRLLVQRQSELLGEMAKERSRLEGVANNALDKLTALTNDQGCTCACSTIPADATWSWAHAHLSSSIVRSSVALDMASCTRFACRHCGTHYNVSKDGAHWSAMTLLDAILAASPTWLRLQMEHQQTEQQLSEQERKFVRAVLSDATLAHNVGNWREHLQTQDGADHNGPKGRGTERAIAIQTAEHQQHVAHIAHYLALLSPATVGLHTEQTESETRDEGTTLHQCAPTRLTGAH